MQLLRNLMAGAGAPPVNYVDTYITPYGVWSAKKKLISTYSGPLIRVRRLSDNTELDIGTVGGLLDTVSLLAFTGASSSFITKVYQQVAGGPGDILQSTAGSQPRIVNAGVMEPNLVQFDKTDDTMNSTFAAGGLASPKATVFYEGFISNDTRFSDFGAVFDLGYNVSGIVGLAIYRDNRALTGLPGVAFAMSGSSPGPYMLRSFPDAVRNVSTSGHIFCCRFDTTVSSTGDLAVHAFADNNDTGQGTPSAGDPSGNFNYTTLRLAGFAFDVNRQMTLGFKSLIISANDDLSQQTNVLGVM